MSFKRAGDELGRGLRRKKAQDCQSLDSAHFAPSLVFWDVFCIFVILRCTNENKKNLFLVTRYRLTEKKKKK